MNADTNWWPFCRSQTL